MDPPATYATEPAPAPAAVTFEERVPPRGRCCPTARTWTCYAAVTVVFELIAIIWIVVDFNGPLGDNLSCLISHVEDTRDLHKWHPDKLAEGSTDALLLVDRLTLELPTTRLNVIEQDLGGFGVLIGIPGGFALFFLTAAMCCATRREGRVVYPTMLVFHGICSSISFIICFAAVAAGFAVDNMINLPTMHGGYYTVKSTCHEAHELLNNTIDNITSTIDIYRDDGLDTSSLWQAHRAAVSMQIVVSGLCECFIDFVDAFVLIGGASTFGVTVFFVAFLLGIAGFYSTACCSPGYDEDVTSAASELDNISEKSDRS